MSASSEKEEGYKRVHFFKYFLTEEDWNARHDYHVQKRRLHQQYLHGTGIHDGLHKLRVMAQTPQSLKVDVTPGYATDSLGRMVMVKEQESVTVELDKFQLPTTLYIKIVY